jgi:hypothetical protein
MNIELKPRTTSFVAPVSANDNAEQCSYPLTSGLYPARRRVLIYQPAKSAMTSGRAGTKRWLLELEPQSPPFIEPLMGWTGTTDPMTQVRLTFPTRDAAVAYAERHGLDYEGRRGKASDSLPPVAQRQSQPMPLWPLALLPDWNSLWLPEIDVIGIGANLAA